MITKLIGLRIHTTGPDEFELVRLRRKMLERVRLSLLSDSPILHASSLDVRIRKTTPF